MFETTASEFKFRPSIEKLLKILRGISLFALPGTFLIYALGFFVWNVYLAQFGIFEDNFLQTRYLATGISSFIITLDFIFLLVILLYPLKRVSHWLKKINFIKEHICGILYNGLMSIFFLALTFYALVIFPHVPKYFGGAQPVAASLLGSPEQMKYLSNFNIRLAENAEGKDPVQTAPVCVLYQNGDHILIGGQFTVDDPASSTSKFVYQRILFVELSQIIGFQFGLTDTRCVAEDFYIRKIPKNNPSFDSILNEEPKYSCEGIQ